MINSAAPDRLDHSMVSTTGNHRHHREGKREQTAGQGCESPQQHPDRSQQKISASTAARSSRVRAAAITVSNKPRNTPA